MNNSKTPVMVCNLHRRAERAVAPGSNSVIDLLKELQVVMREEDAVQPHEMYHLTNAPQNKKMRHKTTKRTGWLRAVVIGLYRSMWLIPADGAVNAIVRRHVKHSSSTGASMPIMAPI